MPRKDKIISRLQCTEHNSLGIEDTLRSYSQHKFKAQNIVNKQINRTFLFYVDNRQIYLDFCIILLYKACMKKQILDKDEIEKNIIRISNEILERNIDSSTLIIIGIKNRGDILAKRIAKRIESIGRKKITTSEIDITFYRDDVHLKAYKYVVKQKIQVDITDKNIILVDDVIFTGRSVRAAIDELIDSGRPSSIQLAVLIDRGGRELPIQPDYIGKKMFVKLDKEVLVYLKEVDGEDKALISL